MNVAGASEFVDRLSRRARRVETPTGPQSRMVWRCWGRGRPLVLLHGGAGSWLHWVRNIERLSATRTVWVPDLPGFGDSTLPREGLDADSIAPMVKDGILELCAKEPFDIVGFSFGCMVSAMLAADPPPGLERLVLVSVLGMGLVDATPGLRSLRGVTDGAERESIQRANIQIMMVHDPAAIDELALLECTSAALRVTAFVAAGSSIPTCYSAWQHNGVAARSESGDCRTRYTGSRTIASWRASIRSDFAIEPFLKTLGIGCSTSGPNASTTRSSAISPLQSALRPHDHGILIRANPVSGAESDATEGYRHVDARSNVYHRPGRLHRSHRAPALGTARGGDWQAQRMQVEVTEADLAQARSKIAAIPWPPPMHIVSRA